MIYNMSRCEKIDFMAFFDVRALKWLQNDPEGLQLIDYIKTVSMVKLEKILKLPLKKWFINLLLKIKTITTSTTNITLCYINDIIHVN